ncbi:unnamed protein product [Protopolystoma xenopodis]|uniref:Uncharacterized protein n=1 Tax=Protopolystoma xenopodis TaxID=117903 RepID=A0A3S5BA32_9PLAT|nr:unnamed protein product [Protopolystoma xenopodis]
MITQSYVNTLLIIAYPPTVSDRPAATKKLRSNANAPRADDFTGISADQSASNLVSSHTKEAAATNAEETETTKSNFAVGDDHKLIQDFVLLDLGEPDGSKSFDGREETASRLSVNEDVAETRPFDFDLLGGNYFFTDVASAGEEKVSLLVHQS